MVPAPAPVIPATAAVTDYTLPITPRAALSCSGGFVLLTVVKPKPIQHVPLIIAAGVIVLTCLVQWLHLDTLEQLEARTYDWRVRIAARFPAAAVTNLGFICITDDSIARLNNGSMADGALKFRYGLYWPRHIYGRLLRELSAQGAAAVAFDILFGELRPDHSPILVSTNLESGLAEFVSALHPDPQDRPLLIASQLNIESDDYFAWQLHRTGNAFVAAEKGLLPHKLFRNHAAAIGDIAAEKDADGVLRRTRAFQIYRRWHPGFEQAAAEYGLDLDKARIFSDKIILLTPDRQEIKVPLAADGTFDPKNFDPAAKMPCAKPFTEERAWHMGILLAASQLGLDLTRAAVDLPHGKIVLRSNSGNERVIPVDASGFFYVNWELPPDDARLTAAPVETLLAQDIARRHGETNDLKNIWRGKLVVVGSTATGNDLTDLGATPLAKETHLISKHWNIANSILTGRFIHRPSFAADFAIIALLGALSAALSLRLRVLPALFSVLATAALYVGLAVFIYVQQRLWLPVIFPVAGALFIQHGCLVTWRVIFEQTEKRRVRSVFSKIVAPEVVRELLAAETVSLGGARREITVFFADVRGFTAFTDAHREQAAEFVRVHQLTGAEAEKIFDEQAQEALSTVNAYLALVADTIKAHGGTLDKYIGDCVMAFWGAPAEQPRHALNCVRAAIDAQRAIDDLNRDRASENSRRDIENLARTAADQPVRPHLPILSLGTGINSGPAVVGLMGSDAHGLNYTVFGREVNLASRLESLSGRGRIFVGETTFAAIQRDDPVLAAACMALAPATVKGFRDEVKIYEVPWRRPGAVSPIGDDFGSSAAIDTSTTGFIRLDR